MLRVTDLRLDGTVLEPLLERITCAEEACAAGDHFVHRPLGGNAVIATLGGEAEAEVAGRSFRQRPGALFAVAAGTDLDERVLRAWRVRYVVFTGRWGGPLLARLRRVGGAVLHERAPRAWTAALAAVVEDGLDQRPGWDWRIARELAVLLGGLAAEPTTGDDLAARVGALVDAAPERPWGVVGLARELGLAPRTFQARFTAATGEGPVRWILRRRLSHARVLLERGLAVNAVAERLGFANPFHFSRVCRRLLGAAPSQMRGTSVDGFP